MIWGIILQALIQLALKYGLDWLKKIIQKYWPDIDWPSIEVKFEQAKKAQQKSKDKIKECVGAACAMKPVQD